MRFLVLAGVVGRCARCGHPDACGLARARRGYVGRPQARRRAAPTWSRWRHAG